MSMAYDVWVVVFGFDADEEGEIVSAVEDLGFDQGDVDRDNIAMEGKDTLEVGSSTAHFAETIAHSVWLANGSFCEVQVSVVCRDCTAGEEFYFDEDVDYAYFLNEQQERIAEVLR